MTQQELEKRLREAIVVRSRRRTVSIEVKETGELLIRAPYFTSNREIQRFVRGNIVWITRQLKKSDERAKEQSGAVPFSKEEIEALADEALAALPPRVDEFARIMGVSRGRVTIRCQKTRWGSCSAKGNINLNCLLMLFPETIRDYVIVHELAHLREMNHSKRFWSIVEEIIPDYRERRKWLREKGRPVIARLRS